MTLPTGPAVTFLFTDIEGSTRLEQALGSLVWAETVADHDAILRRAIESAGGSVVKTEGDAFFAAFARPGPAIEAIVAGVRALAAAPWPEGVSLRIRAALHLGEGRLRRAGPAGGDDYVGIDVNYAARISAAANGGQVLLSAAVTTALDGELSAVLERTGTTLVDEGLRRVKDFDEPAGLHRLVVPGAAEDDRPLRTLEPPTNLPREATSLIGREAEIEQLEGALRESRVVTLSGPGGSGKTRLAVGLADAVRDRFPHGAWFVDLASTRDPALFEPTIAALVGIRDSAELRAEAALVAYLRDRVVLLVLDNVEQLLPEIAGRIAALVRATAAVRVVATTRELLRISGEYGYVVPPLAQPAGIALFEDRARRHRPGLELGAADRRVVAQITERLAGLPLAIELAAARVRLLPVTAILERLGRSLDLAGGARDVPERQRTLRGAIDWSHDLLSDPERRLFRRLGVFAGGWSAELAASIVDDGHLDGDLLELLESLVDKSLVRVEEAGGGETRFSLHPILREYATERLEASGELEAFEARHASAFVELAVRLGPAIVGSGGGTTLAEIDREQHNLRAAVDRLVRRDAVLPAIRLVAATWRWYQQRGRLGEARALLGDLLARPTSHDDPMVRILGLEADGGLAYWMDDMAGARTRYEERLVLAEATGDPPTIAAAHYDIAFVYLVAKDTTTMRAHASRALDIYTAAGDDVAIRRVNQALNVADFLDGDLLSARGREEDNLADFQRRNMWLAAADSITLLSAIDYRLEDIASAWARATEGLRLFADLDLASGLARALGMAAIIQLEHGDAAFGARVAGATLELQRAKNVMVAPTTVLHLPGVEELALQRLGEEAARDLLAEGGATPLAEVIAAVAAADPPA